MHRPRFNLHAAGWVLLLLSLGAAGQTPTPTPQPAETPAAAGAITGRVVNESGQAVPNATVVAQVVGAAVPGRSAIADREGNFKITGLEPVSYNVYAQMPSYVNAPRDPDSPQSSQAVSVGDSVTIVLIKGGVITGTVTNLAGEPIINIGVRAQMVRDGNGRALPGAASGRTGTTDDRGVYRIYGLRAGSYVVLAGGPSDFSRNAINAFALDVPTYAASSNRENAAEVSVRTGEEATNVDIRYRAERGRIISGVVSGPETENAGVDVILTSVSENTPPRDMSTFQQRTHDFAFAGLPDGNYLVTARTINQARDFGLSESRAITLSGADVTGIDLIPRTMGSVAGRVVLEETKAPECTQKTRPAFKDMFISAWHNDNQAAKNQPQFVWAYGAPVHPDEQGNVVIKNLAAGQYYFAARIPTPSWYLQSVSLTPVKPGKAVDASRVWTSVRLGERVSGLTVTLAQGAATLLGQLVLAEGETRPENVLVLLVPAESERANDILRYYNTPVLVDGKITFNNLAPGRYWVLAKVGTPGAAASPLTKLRYPDETETRARLRREAEEGKNEIEFKPCQNVVGFELPLKSVAQ